MTGAQVQVAPGQQVVPQSVEPGGHAPQVPLTQLPLQHWLLLLHFFPLRLQSSFSPWSSSSWAAATPPMPRDASVPPTRAAPINLSALRRETLPLASPLASSSKERLVVSPLTCCPLSPKGGTPRLRRVIERLHASDSGYP